MPASRGGGDPDRWLPPFWVPVTGGFIPPALCTLPFPPVQFWPATFLAPLPLVWAVLKCSQSPFRLGLSVCLGVVPLHLFEHQ